ncbi:chloride channel protein, CIC family [Pelagirhabdus alkalitolerans]|uniref:Chloride channel protein, CIC family n=1 Tax=Pelagirhabdus alkalitolerans TaxID=1612202 RepID=A0A1G6IME9_9BACI|nr:chloride channel protein [Pelagirhabdus alkalitolerans]SDC07657.1 chloride channel protein, CIC family [Pelagirhabdus alkalitolerans]
MEKMRYGNKYMMKWMFFATLVGIGGGLSALALNAAIDAVTFLGVRVPIHLAPIIGGVIVTLLYKFDPDVFGSGSAKYIDSVNLYQGHVKRRTWIAKLIASASTIGFRGSGGVEGPMLLMGGSTANFISKWKRVSKWIDKEDHRILTVCGAAGAIGAIFRSPLGGGIFAAEILYKSSLHYSDVFPAILSSSMGFIVYSTLGTSNPMFAMRDYVTTPTNVFYYILAGIIAGYISVLFMQLFHKVEYFGDWLNKHGLEGYLPILGGILTGFILLYYPSAAGTGTDFIQSLIEHSYGTSFLIAILIAKMLATSFTVGFRGSAGLVIPALFIGAVVGGILSNYLVDGTNGLSNALMVSGMTASLASVANVPIAAPIMLIEMVGFQVGGSAVIGSVVGYIVGHRKVVYINMRSDDPDFRVAKDFRKSDRYFETKD